MAHNAVIAGPILLTKLRCAGSSRAIAAAIKYEGITVQKMPSNTPMVMSSSLIVFNCSELKDR